MNQQSLNSPGAPIYGSERLPVKLPERLYGREADLEAIHVMLRAGTAVLLHGPAGFGKTTAVTAWLAGSSAEERAVAWVSLDDSDEQAASFWTYVVAGLQSARPDVGATALPLLLSQPRP